jgi:hypothetical protein
MTGLTTLSRFLAVTTVFATVLATVFGVCRAQKTLYECMKQAQDQHGVQDLTTPEQIRSYFDCFDVDGKGHIHHSDVAKIGNSTDEEHIAMISALDTNGDGVVHPGEFDSKLATASTTTSTSSSLWAGLGTVLSLVLTATVVSALM